LTHDLEQVRETSLEHDLRRQGQRMGTSLIENDEQKSEQSS
jgi:hypothetical protein